MEFLSQALPLVVWFLLAVLLIVFIIVGIKLIETINATNDILDDIEKKSRSLDGIFDAVEDIGDSLNSVTEKVMDGTVGLVKKLFYNKFRKNKEDDYDE